MDRTVTTTTPGTNRADMNLIGYIVAAGVILVLIPVLPLILVLEIIDRLGTSGGPEEVEPVAE